MVYKDTGSGRANWKSRFTGDLETLATQRDLEISKSLARTNRQMNSAATDIWGCNELRRDHYWRQLCRLVCRSAIGASPQARSGPGFRKAAKPFRAIHSRLFRSRWAAAFSHI